MPIPAIVGAVASAIPAIVGAVSSAKAAKQASNRQANASLVSAGINTAMGVASNLWQSAENRKAWNKNLEYWNLQNSYNAPAAQVARLKAAGLNPNLVYGNGSAELTAQSVAGAQPADVGQMSPIDLSGYGKSGSQGLADYMMLRTGAAQIRNMEASAAAQEASARYTGSKIKTESLSQDSILLENYSKRLENEFKEYTKQMRIAAYKAGLRGQELDNLSKDLNYQSSQYDLAFKKATFDANVDKFFTSLLLDKQALQNSIATLYNINANTRSINTDTDWRKEHYDRGVGTTPFETLFSRGARTLDTDAWSAFKNSTLFPIRSFGKGLKYMSDFGDRVRGRMFLGLYRKFK